MVKRCCFIVLTTIIAATACGSPTAPTSRSATDTSPAPNPSPGELGIRAASVIEFQYAGSDRWSYAPQLLVAETSGIGAVHVTSAEFTLPGFHSQTRRCTTDQGVEPGHTRELFQDFYGDYPVTFDEAGVRATGEVIVVIGYHDGSGRTFTLTTRAPIRQGGLPQLSYTGGGGFWACRG